MGPPRGPPSAGHLHSYKWKFRSLSTLGAVLPSGKEFAPWCQLAGSREATASSLGEEECAWPSPRRSGYQGLQAPSCGRVQAGGGVARGEGFASGQGWQS